MTKAPMSVSQDTPISEVRTLLKEYGIRHLPVIENGAVVGIISDRLVKEASSMKANLSLSASDVMIPSPERVTPETPLDEVAAGMAEEKYGCVLVEDNQKKLVGIFTTVDACRALRQVLETHYLD